MPETNYTPKVRLERLAMFAVSDALIDAAIARIEAKGTKVHGHSGSVLIEHRTGTGTVRRYYATESTLARTGGGR